MKMVLRLASRNVPVASSRTCPWSRGVSAKTKLSRSIRLAVLAYLAANFPLMVSIGVSKVVRVFKAAADIGSDIYRREDKAR
jgi:hypothetical protein